MLEDALQGEDDMTEAKFIGQRIRGFRDRLGMSPEQWANHIKQVHGEEITGRTIRTLEMGLSQNPHLSTRRIMALAMELDDPRDLFPPGPLNVGERVSAA